MYPDTRTPTYKPYNMYAYPPINQTRHARNGEARSTNIATHSSQECTLSPNHATVRYTQQHASCIYNLKCDVHQSYSKINGTSTSELRPA
ncbi:unnamed protein product [Ectocarpus sp. CCAP 1310/34]|nr:unnamed protein product [Ectocarpus sp. CCAP 1310/34]